MDAAAFVLCVSSTPPNVTNKDIRHIAHRQPYSAQWSLLEYTMHHLFFRTQRVQFQTQVSIP